MRQICDVVLERRGEDWRKQVRLKEAELRTICSFIAAGAGDEKGLKAAHGIELLPPTEAEAEANLPSTDSVLGMLSQAR